MSFGDGSFKALEEDDWSDVVRKVAHGYLFHGCDDCPMYAIAEVCDSKPINCTLLHLSRVHEYFESIVQCRDCLSLSEAADGSPYCGDWMRRVPLDGFCFKGKRRDA